MSPPTGAGFTLAPSQEILFETKIPFFLRRRRRARRLEESDASAPIDLVDHQWFDLQVVSFAIIEQGDAVRHSLVIPVTKIEEVGARRAAELFSGLFEQA